LRLARQLNFAGLKASRKLKHHEVRLGSPIPSRASRWCELGATVALSLLKKIPLAASPR
jgi:hypothetical protein